MRQAMASRTYWQPKGYASSGVFNWVASGRPKEGRTPTFSGNTVCWLGQQIEKAGTSYLRWPPILLIHTTEEESEGKMRLN